MPFVKIDTGILNSTIWFDREAREVFLTALLMAVPRQFSDPIPQLNVRNLTETGWSAPPGWYGMVEAAGPGIVDRAQVEQAAGIAALERLGAPESSSRSREFDGRRLIRVDGGYLVLNYMRYRDKDYTSAIRSKRYREKKKASRHAVARDRHGARGRDITQAYAYTYSDNLKEKPSPKTPPNAGPVVGHKTPNGKAPETKAWSARVIDTWRAIAGEPPIGRLLAALKPVWSDLQDADKLCGGVERWLKAGNAKYGPEVFAREWRTWCLPAEEPMSALGFGDEDFFVAPSHGP